MNGCVKRVDLGLTLCSCNLLMFHVWNRMTGVKRVRIFFFVKNYLVSEVKSS